MTDEPAGRQIRPIPPGGRGRPWARVVAGGSLGLLSEVVTFLAVRSRLPGEIPSHYGPTGQVTATLSPVEFLLTAMVVQALATAVVAAVVFFAFRSGVLEHQHGPGFAPALGFALAVLVFVVSVPSSLLLLGDAGGVPGGGVGTVVIGGIFLIVPVAVLFAVLGTRGRGADRSDAGARFRCSSCGATFSAPRWRWVLGPHVGGSVYLLCPVCGERGWDLRVGTPYFPGSAAVDRSRRPE